MINELPLAVCLAAEAAVSAPAFKVNHLCSYPSIYTLGHRYLGELFMSDVVVEEKIDGSQFSMCRNEDGTLSIRSKGQEIHLGAVPKMFEKAVETASKIPLHPGWVYRGEYLEKPKHNTLAYSRTPNQNIILFDVMTGPEIYLSPSLKQAEAERLGLECVPLLFCGLVTDLEALKKHLERDSVLGGCKIEGFVVKNYERFSIEKKILIGKFVSDDFKERHSGEWKKSNPGTADIVQNLVVQLKTEARWRKTIQHLRDNGALTNTPADIGPLLKELQTDLDREETEFIKERLFDHFSKQIKRGVCAGFPEFYKEQIFSLQLPAQPTVHNEVV